MKRNILLLTLMIITACQPVTGIETPSKIALPAPTQPIQKDSTPMSQPVSSPLDTLIEKAKKDLAQRLSIPIGKIDLKETRKVVWADGSLGCPKPGMMYTQALIEGYLIRLDVEGRVYEYHTNRNTNIVYCSNPKSPPSSAPLK